MSAVAETIQVRSCTNRWISDTFPEQRRHIAHTAPVLAGDGSWRVSLIVKNGRVSAPMGELVVTGGIVRLLHDSPQAVAERVEAYVRSESKHDKLQSEIGQYHDFRFGDGIKGARRLDSMSVDLLLTDPPYGISSPYTCEQQVPRRLRKDGRDFIMPKGHFGDWDDTFPSPRQWTRTVLSKVRGWAVIFCAQAQIGEYTSILKNHKFVAVGTFVWQKTNPVPFNHTHKPINAWEAVVIGKRPRTKFNGRVVHNVLLCKSPSPQHRIHPTQKPLALIDEFVRLFSDEGDLLLDPFAGSATTVISAAKQQRRVIAFENDPQLFQVAAARVAGMGAAPVTAEEFGALLKQGTKTHQVYEVLRNRKWHCRECEYTHVQTSQIAGGAGIQGLQRGSGSRPGMDIESGNHLCVTCDRQTRHDRWTGNFLESTVASSMPRSFQTKVGQVLGWKDAVELVERSPSQLTVDHKLPMLRWSEGTKSAQTNYSQMSDDDIRVNFQMLKKSNGSVSHNLLKSRSCETCYKRLVNAALHSALHSSMLEARGGHQPTNETLAGARAVAGMTSLHGERH